MSAKQREGIVSTEILSLKEAVYMSQMKAKTDRFKVNLAKSAPVPWAIRIARAIDSLVGRICWIPASSYYP